AGTTGTTYFDIFADAPMAAVVVVEADELCRLITEAVATALQKETARDEWIDARSSGLGRRTFLRLAREGAFPVSKVGKRYVARRSDIAAYLDRQRVTDASANGAQGATAHCRTDAPQAPDDDGTRPRAGGRKGDAALDAPKTDANRDDPVARALA